MNTFFEYLPLAALLSPVLVVAAMNVALRFTGEEGTLLFPGHGAYPGAAMPEIAHFFPTRETVMEEQEMPEPEFRKAA